MKKKLTQKLTGKMTNNLTLKLVAVLVAVFIWLFASSASDPVITAEYSVKVDVTNDEYIMKSGKTYQIDDTKREVMVYIRGKTSVVSRRRDITVEADMTQIVEMSKDATQVYVPVQFKPVGGISMRDVEIYPKTIPVSIEDVESKVFVVTVNTRGTPAKGYEIGECMPSLETVRIQGPKSTIEKIKSVVAPVDVSGLGIDTRKKATLQVIDLYGNVLPDDTMEYLNFISVGPERTVDVGIDLWCIVDDVKIRANYSGTPTKGYQVDKITTTPETISVAGSEEALKKLAENDNTIEIPASLINVDGLSRDFDANIKLSSLLEEKEGFKVPADATQSVMVKVSILPYGSKEFEVNTKSIHIIGLNEKFWVNFSQPTLVVRIKGKTADLDELKTVQIKTSIDLTDKVEGEYTLPVSVTLPEGYEQVESVLATVQLTKMERTGE